jgi:hypothetical protein
MKTLKLYLFTVIIALSSCSEDIMDDINKNVNNPVKVASKFILTDVMTNTAFSVTGSDYAFYSSVYMEYNVGTWGQMYNAEIRQNEPTSATTYNNSWVNQYANLYSLKTVIEKCSKGGDEAGNYQNLGIAQVLTAYNLAMLTDLMGDAPYSEALKPGVNFQPKLDKQEDLYKVVFAMLDSAILNLGRTTTFASLGTQDFIYAGSSPKWLKAANGLKARYTMRLSLKSAQYDKVVQYVDAAFTSAADELKYVYNGSTSVNPFSRFFRDRDYFGASASLKAKLDARTDPRIAKFFKVYPAAGTTMIFATNGNPEQVQKKFAISALNADTKPTHLLSYHELLFLKAEAYARMSPAQTANAETALKNAISAAFVKVGLTATDATTYYTTTVKALFDANPLQEIMIQKYLAMYDEEAIETYSDYRRVKAMGNNFVVLANSKNATQFPLRFTYGNSDVTTNNNIKSAYGDGSYVYTEKVWWAGGTR